ncbi:MAG: hypothetical protein AB7F59_13265 [Bdellovibrionales bacterium]
MQLYYREGGYSSGEYGLIQEGQYYSTGYSLARRLDTPYININPLQVEMASGSKGETLIDRNQYYSFKSMEDIQYVDPREIQFHSNALKKLSTDQITFFEITDELTRAELVKRYGKIPDHARRDPVDRGVEEHFAMTDMSLLDENKPESKDRQKYRLKVGASVLISGQPFGKKASLALEDERLLVPIDRTKYKHIWELGRAARDNEYEYGFEEAIRISAFYAYHELILNGGKVEDAYIFGHSLDRGHSGLYMRTHRMKRFSGYKDNPNELALVIPLKDVLMKYGLDKVSFSIADLVQKTEGRMSAEALRHWQLFARGQSSQSLKDGSQNKAQYELRNFSSLLEKLITAKVLKAGVTESDAQDIASQFSQELPLEQFRDQMAKYAEISARPYVTPIQGVFVVDPHFARTTGARIQRLQELDEFLKEQNAIEVYSGDKEVLSGLQQLVGAYLHVWRQLYESGFTNPDSVMKEQNVQFAVTTTKAQVMQQLEALPYAKKWFVYRHELVSAHNNWAFNYRETIKPRIDWRTYAFTVADIQKIMKENPAVRWRQFQLDREAQYKTLMSQPDMLSP